MTGFSKEAARALVTTPPQGEASYIVTATTTAASVNLGTIGTQVQNIANSQSQSVGAFKSFLTIVNDGTVTLYVSTSPTAQTATVATTGTNQATAVYPIFANSKERWEIRPTLDIFLNFVAASTTTTLRAFVTSDQG